MNASDHPSTPDSSVSSNAQPTQGKGADANRSRRSILIGSQREPHAPAAPEQPFAGTGAESDAPSTQGHSVAGTHSAARREADDDRDAGADESQGKSALVAEAAVQAPSFPPPRLSRVSDDLQREIDAALGEVSLDSLMEKSTKFTATIPEPEIEGRYRATVMKIAKDSIFFALPGHYEGVASVRQFDNPPEVGAVLDIVVNRYNRAENLYEVSVPGASMQVADWSDLQEGIAVDAKITGHNSGGLECEVNGIRGFIPVSQVSLYRVENLEEFVNERFACIVTEANPARRNLVLSRRAYLEREKEAAREQMMESLAVGQTHEGVVRSIRDFGAFVDMGGVDGLIHISKLSWDRVKHPSEVLQEGQKVKVKIDKIDEATNKISLSLRDTADHPWENIDAKYPVNTVVSGTVSKIMDFGAFVRLEAGIEGLVHISELAHHRVVRVDKVVKEGDAVQVKVLSVDPASQRISLSMKATQAAPAPVEEAKVEEAPEPAREPVVRKSGKPLKGGTGRKSGGDQFGLKW